VQARHDIAEEHHLYAGARVDRNSGYKVAPTVRFGYVGSLDGRRAGAIGVKALYGQAFREPSPRVLYGGWTGSGSDPDLDPERSSTAEVAVTQTLERVSQSIDLYWVRSADRIVVGAEPGNSGRGSVVGVDYAVRARLNVPSVGRVELWGTYSHLFHATEEEDQGGVVTRYEFGDLARHKVHAGATARRGEHLALDLRARWVSDRATVPTNPIGRVDGFATADANLSYRNLLDSGVGLSLGVSNLFDARYTEPGINDAGAGDDPGTFDAMGNYVGGAAGYFNSEMPQPGRTFFVSLWLDR
jgi:outer membrane receptor protein involved in Fe transport